MGMSATFRHVSARALDALLRSPSLAPELAAVANPFGDLSGALREADAHVATLPDERSNAHRANLERFAELHESLAAVHRGSTDALAKASVVPSELAAPIGIEKAWHGLHLVLTDMDQLPTTPPRNAVLGGREVGEDLGYGALRYLEVDEVRATAAALSALGEAAFRAKCDLDALGTAGAYALDASNPEEIEWLVDAFVDVRDYYAEASERGHAMLLYLL